MRDNSPPDAIFANGIGAWPGLALIRYSTSSVPDDPGSAAVSSRISKAPPAIPRSAIAAVTAVATITSVIGSAIRTEYHEKGGKPAHVRPPEVEFVDDRAGQPVGIQRAVGRRPSAAVGNSYVDCEMPRRTTAESGLRLGMIVHHTDAVREWAYDRQSPVGRLAKALDEAPGRGWIVVDLRVDSKQVFTFED